MKKTVAILLFITFLFAACEKDDICDPSTSTTPRLVVQFFDNNNISLTRNTTNLKIVDDAISDAAPLLNEAGGNTWNDSVVYLPLRVNENTTKFKLTLNADDNDATNDKTDVLQINYTKNDIYISRACGFKAQFNLFGNPQQQPVILNDNPAAIEGNWIKNIQVIQSQINDENETHVKIFF
jgi:hypothetical protein